MVEVEGRDRLGRAQVLAVDLFAAGDDKISWPKPTAALFEVSSDQKSYAPGDVAKLVLHSPFQQARALAVVEAQDGNRYSWVDVRGGQGVFELAGRGALHAAAAGPFPALPRPPRRASSRSPATTSTSASRPPWRPPNGWRSRRWPTR